MRVKKKKEKMTAKMRIGRVPKRLKEKEKKKKREREEKRQRERERQKTQRRTKPMRIEHHPFRLYR